MDITKETTDWGIIYYYKNDCCRFALYAYNDDKNTMYLSNVKVEQSARGRGLGNKILELADKEAKKYNYTVICLKVLKSSWVHDWYANHGYSDFCYDGEDADYVWMKHTLSSISSPLFYYYVEKKHGMNPAKINRIINESINNLLFEEFGIAYGLEPLCDYLLERFFDFMLNQCFNETPFTELEFEQEISMQEIKSDISCKNWYGIDRLNYIVLKTVVNSSDYASLNYDSLENLKPIIVLNIGNGFTKRELYNKVSKYGNQKVFNEFCSKYKFSVMHELTHLIELVNTGTKFKAPAYAYMDDPDYENQIDLAQVRRVSLAFSKTEMNARIPTIYYHIINNEDLISGIKRWNGSRRELCKKLISLTSNLSWINEMRKYLFIVRRAAEKGEKPDIDLVRKFIDINIFAANSGSKNLFKFKISDNGLKHNNIIKEAWRLYDKMHDMYYTFTKKLYKSVDLAIEEVINNSM